MGDKRFWEIIAHCCRHDADPDEWHARLTRQLMRMSPQEIVAFDHAFDRRTNAAYTVLLWGED